MDKQENMCAQLKMWNENAKKIMLIEREKSESKIKLLEQVNMDLSEKLSMKEMELAAHQKKLKELRRLYETEKNVIRSQLFINYARF